MGAGLRIATRVPGAPGSGFACIIPAATWPGRGGRGQLRIRFLLENILSTSGITGGEIRCVGGGTHNHFWQQVKANVLGMPIDTPQVTDMTAQGAALIAAFGVGAFQDEAEAARLTYRSAVRYEVQPEEARWYESGYQLRFRKLYPVFRQIELTY